MKTIVVSAVNIRKGGTLTILRDCLSYLSTLPEDEFRVVALVHRKELAFYPGIEYWEFPDTIKSWGRRLWCEYVTMHSVSKQLAPVDLWLSLHDTTPRVKAERQAVYCQTSFPFLKWKWKDLKYDFKIVLFSLLTKYAYKVNIARNRYLVVQAQWLREGFSDMFNLSENHFIVFPPRNKAEIPQTSSLAHTGYMFLFPATADAHKNFETLCEASRIVESRIGKNDFKVVITIDGNENKYARSLKNTYKDVNSLDMTGFLTKGKLEECYRMADCLVFPSRIETWGLPISEFASYDKPMLLADLPYAYEAAAGCRRVSFFNPGNAEELASKMMALIKGNQEILETVSPKSLKEPLVRSWEELFDTLLSE